MALHERLSWPKWAVPIRYRKMFERGDTYTDCDGVQWSITDGKLMRNDLPIMDAISVRKIQFAHTWERQRRHSGRVTDMWLRANDHITRQEADARLRGVRNWISNVEDTIRIRQKRMQHAIAYGIGPRRFIDLFGPGRPDRVIDTELLDCKTVVFNRIGTVTGRMSSTRTDFKPDLILLDEVEDDILDHVYVAKDGERFHTPEGLSEHNAMLEEIEIEARANVMESHVRAEAQRLKKERMPESQHRKDIHERIVPHWPEGEEKLDFDQVITLIREASRHPSDEFGGHFSQVRLVFSNAYKRWQQQEDRGLEEMIMVAAELFGVAVGRSRHAILCRMHKYLNENARRLNLR